MKYTTIRFNHNTGSIEEGLFLSPEETARLVDTASGLLAQYAAGEAKLTELLEKAYQACHHINEYTFLVYVIGSSVRAYQSEQEGRALLKMIAKHL